MYCIKCTCVAHFCLCSITPFCFLLFFLKLLYSCCADDLSGAKSNYLFPLIHPDKMRDLRNNSQFRPKIPVQLRVIWFLCSPEIYMYSAYQLDYWQVGRITQFEVTCFSVCSIQCHIALEEEGYCFVEWMRNFLAPPFPGSGCSFIPMFCCFFFFFSFISFCIAQPQGITKLSNVNVLQSDNGFKWCI